MDKKMKPIRGWPLSADALKAHSEAGALGWQLVDGLPEGAPPNACGAYQRGQRRALLCRDRRTGVHVLAEYTREKES